MRTLILHHFHTFYPDLEREVEELAAQDKALATAQARRGDPDAEQPKRRASEPAVDLDAEREAVKAKIAENVAKRSSGIVRLIFTAKNRKEFRRLVTEHPPREDDPLDAQTGFNVDTFGDALIKACLTRCENLDGKKVTNRWDKWADEMTDGQWEEIFRKVLKLNRDGNPTTFPR
jgi:hypothetical protein